MRQEEADQGLCRVVEENRGLRGEKGLPVCRFLILVVGRPDDAKRVEVELPVESLRELFWFHGCKDQPAQPAQQVVVRTDVSVEHPIQVRKLLRCKSVICIALLWGRV